MISDKLGQQKKNILFQKQRSNLCNVDYEAEVFSKLC